MKLLTEFLNYCGIWLLLYHGISSFFPFHIFGISRNPFWGWPFYVARGTKSSAVRWQELPLDSRIERRRWGTLSMKTRQGHYEPLSLSEVNLLTGAKRREWMAMGVAGMIITSDYGSFPHSLLSTSKFMETFESWWLFRASAISGCLRMSWVGIA